MWAHGSRHHVRLFNINIACKITAIKFTAAGARAEKHLQFRRQQTQFRIFYLSRNVLLPSRVRGGKRREHKFPPRVHSGALHDVVMLSCAISTREETERNFISLPFRFGSMRCLSEKSAFVDSISSLFGEARNVLSINFPISSIVVWWTHMIMNKHRPGLRLAPGRTTINGISHASFPWHKNIFLHRSIWN